MIVLPSSGEMWKLSFLSGGQDSAAKLHSWHEHHFNAGRHVPLLAQAISFAFHKQHSQSVGGQRCRMLLCLVVSVTFFFYLMSDKLLGFSHISSIYFNDCLFPHSHHFSVFTVRRHEFKCVRLCHLFITKDEQPIF